jgi:uncharacterized protein YndB with AHSA1/START domain
MTLSHRNLPLRDLPHTLDRTVVIQADPPTVFSFFTDNDRWASWWGAGSTIDPKSGGRVYIRHANGIESSGEVIEVQPPTRIVFTYGFDSGHPIPPGSSRVTISLEPQGAATRLDLRHEFEEAGPRDEHVQGWRYQLSVFGNVVADLVNAGAVDTVDAWLAVWSDPSEEGRRQTLTRIATSKVRFRDRFSLLDGREDLVLHIGATQRFMPGLQLCRHGDVRHCQGTLLVDWVAVGTHGSQRGAGTNVFVLQADGKVDSVTGFWK